MTDLPLRAPGPTPDAATTAIVAHAGVRVRLTDLLRGADEARMAATVVPACPDWSVTDTLAHTVGVCIDIAEGTLGTDVGTAAWADDHVTRFTGLGVAGLLERWAEVGPVIDSLAGMMSKRVASQFCFDATTHEHDIRGALGQPGGQDSDGVEVGIRFMEMGLDHGVRNAGLAPVLFVSDVDRVVIGAPDGPGALEASAVDDLPTLRAPRFELLRAIGGRRSAAQVRAMAWTTDPEPYLALLTMGPLRPPEHALAI